jgi:hypothetical protein
MVRGWRNHTAVGFIDCALLNKGFHLIIRHDHSTEEETVQFNERTLSADHIGYNTECIIIGISIDIDIIVSGDQRDIFIIVDINGCCDWWRSRFHNNIQLLSSQCITL